MKSTATILSVALSAAPGAVAAFSSQATRVNVASIRCPIGAAGAISASGSKLYMNIPAPTTEGGASPEEIKAAADREAPPSSFYELQRASVKAAKMAIADDHRLLEIEVRHC